MEGSRSAPAPATNRFRKQQAPEAAAPAAVETWEPGAAAGGRRGASPRADRCSRPQGPTGKDRAAPRRRLGICDSGCRCSTRNSPGPAPRSPAPGRASPPAADSIPPPIPRRRRVRGPLPDRWPTGSRSSSRTPPRRRRGGHGRRARRGAAAAGRPPSARPAGGRGGGSSRRAPAGGPAAAPYPGRGRGPRPSADPGSAEGDPSGGARFNSGSRSRRTPRRRSSPVRRGSARTPRA